MFNYITKFLGKSSTEFMYLIFPNQTVKFIMASLKAEIPLLNVTQTVTLPEVSHLSGHDA